MDTIEKINLQVQRQLLKDDIVDTCSRFIKECDQPVINGMTEVADSWVRKLDRLLFCLQDVENKIKDFDINNKS